MESVSAANTHFSLNVFQKISEGNQSANVFYSPLSLSAALSMLSLGAAGNTAAQMCQVMMTTAAAVIIVKYLNDKTKSIESSELVNAAMSSSAVFIQSVFALWLTWVCLILNFGIGHKAPLIATVSFIH